MAPIRLARLALCLALLAFDASARADQPAAGAEPEQPPPSSAHTAPSDATAGSETEDAAGFTLQLGLGYGSSTQRVLQVKVEPYGAQLRLDLGYRFRHYGRVGVYVEYGFGQAVEQSYQPVLGDPFEFTAEASSVNSGASIGYDVPVYFLLLRYSIEIGFTRLGWDFKDVRRRGIPGFATDKGSQFSFHIAPSLALLWPVGHFEYGLGFSYLVQTADKVPAGVAGKLTVGVAL